MQNTAVSIIRSSWQLCWVQVMCPAGDWRTRRGSDLQRRRSAIHPISNPVFTATHWVILSDFISLALHIYDNQLRLADRRRHESARNRMEESVPETMDERTRRCCSHRWRPGAQGNHRRWENRVKTRRPGRNPCHCIFCPASVPSGGRGHWDTPPMQSKQVYWRTYTTSVGALYVFSAYFVKPRSYKLS